MQKKPAKGAGQFDRAPLSPSLRIAVFRKAAARCQFVDPRTGHACGSRSLLEVDHIVPVSLGGTNDPRNLRVLCGTHNFAAAEEALGKSLGIVRESIVKRLKRNAVERLRSSLRRPFEELTMKSVTALGLVLICFTAVSAQVSAAETRGQAGAPSGETKVFGRQSDFEDAVRRRLGARPFTVHEIVGNTDVPYVNEVHLEDRLVQVIVESVYRSKQIAENAVTVFALSGRSAGVGRAYEIIDQLRRIGAIRDVLVLSEVSASVAERNYANPNSGDSLISQKQDFLKLADGDARTANLRNISNDFGTGAEETTMHVFEGDSSTLRYVLDFITEEMHSTIRGSQRKLGLDLQIGFRAAIDNKERDFQAARRLFEFYQSFSSFFFFSRMNFLVGIAGVERPLNENDIRQLARSAGPEWTKETLTNVAERLRTRINQIRAETLGYLSWLRDGSHPIHNSDTSSIERAIDQNYRAEKKLNDSLELIGAEKPYVQKAAEDVVKPFGHYSPFPAATTVTDRRGAG